MGTEKEQTVRQEKSYTVQEDEVTQLFNRHYNEYGEVGVVASILFLKKLINNKLIENRIYYETELEKLKVIKEHLEKENILINLENN